MQYARVERIEPTGSEGMYEASLSVRDKPTDFYHNYAITIIGKDLTECVERTHKVLSAFND